MICKPELQEEKRKNLDEACVWKKRESWRRKLWKQGKLKNSTSTWERFDKNSFQYVL